MVGAVVAFSVFSMRATVLASWEHRDNPDIYKGDVAVRDYGEVPRELLVYAHTSGDIPAPVKEIEKAAAQLDDLRIVFRSSSTAPTASRGRGRGIPRDSKFKNVTYTSIDSEIHAAAGGDHLRQHCGALRTCSSSVNPTTRAFRITRRWFPEEYRGVDGDVLYAGLFRRFRSRPASSSTTG